MALSERMAAIQNLTTGNILIYRKNNKPAQSPRFGLWRPQFLSPTWLNNFPFPSSAPLTPVVVPRRVGADFLILSNLTITRRVLYLSELRETRVDPNVPDNRMASSRNDCLAG